MNTVGHSPFPVFSRLDWVLLIGVGMMWGASFLFIKLGVAAFAPTTVAWLRLLFGAATLALLPGARKPLKHKGDGWLVAVLGLTWMAVPFNLFPIAEQSIGSGLAGMINGAAPLFTAIIAVLWFRNRPAPVVIVGLIIGFVGVLVISLPSITGGGGLLGIGLVLLATVLYGVAFNLAGPLESRNGALAVIWRAELVALVATSPAGIVGLAHSAPTWGGFAALVVLGAVSTGIAFGCFVTLVGRIGAPRAAVSTYLAPVVAIVLGALVAHETIHLLTLVGIVLVLLGAFLCSLRGKKPAS
jgi:drug/metabolite transporter (DMT)-like permease